jgi:hypothetical protein
MRWLAEQRGPIDRFNQSMLPQVPAGLRRSIWSPPCRASSIITMHCGCASMQVRY